MERQLDLSSVAARLREYGVFLCVYTDCGLVSLAWLWPVRGRWTRIKYIIGLTGLAEAFRHSWYQSKKYMEWLIEEIGVVEEMIWRKASVPPVAVPPGDGETVPIAPVPPRVEVPFVAPVPPPPPVLLAEEPVMQLYLKVCPRILYFFSVFVEIWLCNL
ncbi:hypothetical protein Taro_027316 [Colocasia esculenta]|uniref:Uncharacterized protein n=1 Tax=Colocasia esculenta TaxID=4460 RepID=A0A843VM61_COLES|nr:hypothetical protein [Colocasia esculenta]